MAFDGVPGHHLAATGSPLPIETSQRHGGRTPVRARDALAEAGAGAGAKPDVLLLGPCVNFLQRARAAARGCGTRPTR